jgi:hypothetical protein
VWNVNRLLKGGTSATALTAAFVDTMVHQLVVRPPLWMSAALGDVQIDQIASVPSVRAQRPCPATCPEISIRLANVAACHV